MLGNKSLGNDGGSESWIPQQVCGDDRSVRHGSNKTAGSNRAAAGSNNRKVADSNSAGGSNSNEMEDVTGAVQIALDTCRTNHQFIASQAEHLQRLRSQCATSAPITRQEIRALEVKLVRLFGQQLACKRRLPACASLPPELSAFPCLSQWLTVVGLQPDAVQAVCVEVLTLEALLSLGEAAVAAMLTPITPSHSQANKLHRALHNLRRYTASQMSNSGSSSIIESEAPLHWDSWEQRGSCPSSPRTIHKPSPHTPHREARSSVSSSDGDTSDMGSSSLSSSGYYSNHHYHHHHHHKHHHHQQQKQQQQHHRSSDESSTPSSPPVMGITTQHSSNNVSPNMSLPPPSPLHHVPPSLTLQLPPSSTPIHDLRYTPPTTPPVIKTPKSSDKKVSTPPPNKKYLLINPPSDGSSGGSSATGTAFGRSTSHESQLANRRAATTTATESDTPTSASNCNNTHHHQQQDNTANTNYTRNSIPYNNSSNKSAATTTPPHNANDLLLVSPNSAAVSAEHRQQHNRHHSESSSTEQAPLTAYTTHDSRSTAPLSSNQPTPLTALSSPTRHHYAQHPHPYQHAPDDDNYNKNSVVPRSPRTPPLQGAMVHNVQHRFTKSINIKPATCGYCDQKFPILGGLRCKECNFKCHRECESKLPPSCGLPNEYLKIFTASLNNSLQNSNRGGVGGVSPSHQPPDNLRTPPTGPALHHSQHHAFQGPDSSSNTSSCNSSTPSSPALILPPPSPATISSSSSSNSGKHLQQQHLHHHQQHRQQHQSPLSSAAMSHNDAFHYPDVNKHRVSDAWGNFPMRGPPPSSSTPSAVHSLTSTTSSTLSATSSTRSDLLDSDRTTNSGSGSTDDSERTVAERVDSQDSAMSDGVVDGMAGGGGGDTGSIGGISGIVGGEGCSRQNSVSQGFKEWDIPYDELDKGPVIGRGRFGTVYSGNWHGQVAIKELHMECVNDQHALEAFKSEVAMFRKTRHQNLVLFMGACMKLPRLAIITSLCKGNTLYKHIHILKDKFNLTHTISIAQQVAQGMGYLHARGIVHKDLKTKNIFIENSKVVITDFGLFNVTRLCQHNRPGAWLTIPPEWLCYLSPELMRSLKVSTHHPHTLPHTTTSDVYSYGTVWFELLCGELPHKGLPPEAVIWQVGRGIKPSLAHLQASRDVKDILMDCWSYRPDERPDFAVLQKKIKKLPKKRLARSPSHPIHLSRSAECVF
uniref:Kinase suppressor of Ras 2-like isoform X1 n=1 Tax=Hirondellea gigas TaxID=1518452 RepID=A0A6A7FVD0_9CRUS